MPSQILFENNAASLLTNAVLTSDTTIEVANGSIFPNPGAGQFFPVTIVSASNSGANEICYCTAVAVNTLTVTRAQEGTTAQAWNVGDGVTNMITAGALNAFQQSYQTQAQAGNYAVDTGAPNSITLDLTPAVSGTPSAGFPVRFKLGAQPTGATTLSIDNGTTNHPLIYATNGQPILGADMVVGAVYTAIFDGTSWQLQTPTEIQTIYNNGGVCRLYPDGWKDQMGYQATTGSTYTFPVAFTGTLADIFFIPGLNVQGGTGNDVPYGNIISLTQYTLATRAEGGGFSTFACSWRALGK